MALYVPTSTRRRRTGVYVAVALLLGLALGIFGGRFTAPTVASQVLIVQSDAQAISASLRVLALHDQAGVATKSGDGGAQLVLDSTRTKLEALFLKAPWVGQTQRNTVTAELDTLTAMQDRDGSRFGGAAETLANHIDIILGGG